MTCTSSPKERLKLTSPVFGQSVSDSPQERCQSSLEPPWNVQVHRVYENFSVTWDWYSVNSNSDMNVNFSVFYQKLKKRSNKGWKTWPGCLRIPHHICNISSGNLDFHKDYIVRVRAETLQERSPLSSSVKFSPRVPEEIGPPSATHEFIDGGVQIDVESPKPEQGDWDEDDLDYIIIIWKNNSNEEVIVYDNRTRPWAKTEPPIRAVVGPPSDVNVALLDNTLRVVVSEPEGFKENGLKSYCNWLYYLVLWKNTTEKQEEILKDTLTVFVKPDLESSTTYCLKVGVKCESNYRSSQFSDVQCITTKNDTKPIFKWWHTFFLIIGIAFISLFAYICSCPLKRYLKHVFYPSGKLPSSIEKGMFETRAKSPFLLQKEEPTDICYIIRNIKPEDEVEQTDQFSKTSKTNTRDSGNYSNEEEVTGETISSFSKTHPAV
ncbi:interferon alpha/beta receptor 1-like [Rhinophrynus dorsalis]